MTDTVNYPETPSSSKSEVSSKLRQSHAKDRLPGQALGHVACV